MLRYNAHSMNLYELDEHGKMIKIDWETKLQRLGKQAGLFRFICAMILNESPARYMRFRYLPKKRRKPGVKRNSERRTKDVQPRKKTLYLSEWVLILTSVPVELLSTETAAALYRVRWQVELVIKRLKSLLAINQLRARKDSQLAELYLQGKLLYAVVTEKIAQRCFTKALTKMDGPRALTPWRLYKTIAEDIKSGLNACFPKQERFQRDYLKSVAKKTFVAR
ncbi:transposase [methane-oxidizing endosymbiont of Gigantopelta aegis]|uniref:transposase n=1 Tax=methane-oxidizing endosymbiont of Gigantopelta aegis TaxID=2794938 RepID=UPI0018DE20F8|nr:transposase [methane-oxidizing endosymbiont of Gigantopelta aegis]